MVITFIFLAIHGSNPKHFDCGLTTRPVEFYSEVPASIKTMPLIIIKTQITPNNRLVRMTTINIMNTEVQPIPETSVFKVSVTQWVTSKIEFVDV